MTWVMMRKRSEMAILTGVKLSSISITTFGRMLLLRGILKIALFLTAVWTRGHRLASMDGTGEWVAERQVIWCFTAGNICMMRRVLLLSWKLYVF